MEINPLSYDMPWSRGIGHHHNLVDIAMPSSPRRHMAPAPHDNGWFPGESKYQRSHGTPMGRGYYDDWGEHEHRFGESPYQRSLQRQARIVDRSLAHHNGYTHREQFADGAHNGYSRENDDALWQTNTRRVLRQTRGTRQRDLEELYGPEFAHYYDEYRRHSVLYGDITRTSDGHNPWWNEQKLDVYDDAHHRNYGAVTSTSFSDDQIYPPKWHDADDVYNEFVEAHQELEDQPRRVYSRRTAGWDGAPTADGGHHAARRGP